MTWLFPLLGRVLWSLGQLSTNSSGSRVGPISKNPSERCSLDHSPVLAVLIPAHNEAATLGATLASIKQALRYAAAKLPDFEYQIIVGADGCTDASTAIAEESGARVLAVNRSQGKWATLLGLVSAASAAEIVVFADCGIAWPEDFITRVLTEFCERSVIGVAPTYHLRKSGRLERLHWALERHFKSLESNAGGPVSAHGATVAYRRQELVAALAHLQSATWNNDDVVIPLMLRTIFPERTIRYKSDLYVEDLEVGNMADTQETMVQDSRREFVRRLRMVHGNIEWVRSLVPEVFRGNLVAGTLALRRVFRMLWAYWGLAAVIGTLLLVLGMLDRELSLGGGYSAALALVIVGMISLAGIVISRFLDPKRAGVPRLIQAAGASLLVPIYLFRFLSPKEVVWD